MKKAALTFGLFSLIMVATSFATPEKTNKSIAGNIEININIGTDGNGGQGRVGKKSDYAGDSSNYTNSKGSQLNGFELDSQLMKNRVKVD